MRALSKTVRTIPFCFLLMGMVMVIVSQPSMAQFQGKIFTTPEERAYLDALREDFLKKSQEQGFDIDEAGPPPLPEINDEPAETTSVIEYTLGGILTRSDGSRTVWLNNQPVSETDLPSNMSLVADGQLAVLRIATNAGNFQLKPGQTLNASTGKIQEAYQRAAPTVEDVITPAGETEAPPASNQLPSDTEEEVPESSVPEANEADTRATP